MIHLVAGSIVAVIAAWLYCIAVLGVMVLANWIAWTSPRFRKWRWTWLAFFGFPSIIIELPPHSWIGCAFPVGSLVVLWRWKFGASTPEERQAEAAAWPKSIAELLGSRAGYSAALLTALILAAFGGPFGAVAPLMVAASIGLFWMANRYRGQRLARPRAALIASLSWCAVVGLMAALILLDMKGRPPNFGVLGCAFVAMWPLIFCTLALIQNSWVLPKPDPDPAPAG